MKLDPIILTFQFIGITFIAVNNNVAGLIIFLAALCYQYALGYTKAKTVKVEDALKQEIKALSDQVENIKVALNFGRI